MIRIMAHYRGEEALPSVDPIGYNLYPMRAKTAVVGFGRPAASQA